MALPWTLVPRDRPVFSVPGYSSPGLIEPGNIDIAHRPSVPNPEVDGESSVWSTSVNIDGVEVLIPRVSGDGRILTVDEAVAEYRRTGKHLGKFKTSADATAYAQALHKDQESRMLKKPVAQPKEAPARAARPTAPKR